MDRDISYDGERCVPVNILAAASDGDRPRGDSATHLTTARGSNCSPCSEWQHFDNTRHIGNLSGENVNPSEQPRQRELLQGRSASDLVRHRHRGDSNYSEGDDYSDVKSDSQLDTTAATVVTTKNLFGERDRENRHHIDRKYDGSNQCHFDVVSSTRCQAVYSSDQDAYDDDDDDDDDEIQYYTGLRETPTPQFGLVNLAWL